jgi:hypothetical protein
MPVSRRHAVSIEAQDERPTWVTAPVVVLVLANLWPVFGVLFLGWTVFQVVLLFWFENVILGAFTILKILAADPANIFKWFGKIGMIPFFCFHYGIFTIVHGIFVVALVGNGFATDGVFLWTPFRAVADQHLIWAAGVLAIGHAFSFAHDYLGQGEYKTAALQDLMAAPYGRVVVLHITVLAGGMLMATLKPPAFILLLLVGLKILLDARGHRRERKAFGPKEGDGTIPGEV